MRLLVLGGTRFLGRHLVEAALARGDDVTIFTRGRLPVPWGDRVTALAGDRDPQLAPGLDALAGGAWDAVVDCSGYVPRIVEVSARLLAARTNRYVFVSSMSVYAKTEQPGMDERTAVATLDDPATEQVMEHYGALKAACEAVVERIFAERATNVRPGLIVGPLDGTDRFGYWVARFVHPSLLGDRAASAVVPAPRERPVQFIDARDLAGWLLDITMGDLVDAVVAASPAAPALAWIDDATLVDAGVTPWTGLPLWLPPSEPDSGGFMTMDCSRAQRAGLEIRPLADTVVDTAAWLAARDNAGAWKHVLSADVERLLVNRSA